MQHARKKAQAGLEIAAEAIRIQHDHFGTDLLLFKKGDQVWLDGKNIHTDYPSEKLRPKCFGPFEIINTIGTINFKLTAGSTFTTSSMLVNLCPTRKTKSMAPTILNRPLT